MAVTRQLSRPDPPGDRTRSLKIHVAGRGVFVVTQGSREVFRGTFEQCYDYVNAARQGLQC
jgi:hypothetical protein